VRIPVTLTRFADDTLQRISIGITPEARKAGFGGNAILDSVVKADETLDTYKFSEASGFGLADSIVFQGDFRRGLARDS
jgi:hypothetical protein